MIVVLVFGFLPIIDSLFLNSFPSIISPGESIGLSQPTPSPHQLFFLFKKKIKRNTRFLLPSKAQRALSESVSSAPDSRPNVRSYVDLQRSRSRCRPCMSCRRRNEYSYIRRPRFLSPWPGAAGSRSCPNRSGRRRRKFVRRWSI